VCAASPPRRTLLSTQPAFNATDPGYHDDVRIARAAATALLAAAVLTVTVGAVDLRLDAQAITQALSWPPRSPPT
jgi:hypothetical protein